MNIDRAEAARCLAKCIAYKFCGKDDQARDWARSLIKLLQLHDILA